METMIEVDSYEVKDPFFGAPYIDIDEERSTPIPIRYVHGGCSGDQVRGISRSS